MKKNVKDVFNGSSKGLDLYLKSLRSKRNKNNINNAISGRTTNSEYGSRQNIATGGRQREDYIAKSNSNNVNSIQRKLKNSEQSSFSLSENNIKSNEEYDTNLSAEEKLDEYEERKKQALKKIAEKAGFEYSFLDANKGETQHDYVISECSKEL